MPVRYQHKSFIGQRNILASNHYVSRPLRWDDSTPQDPYTCELERLKVLKQDYSQIKRRIIYAGAVYQGVGIVLNDYDLTYTSTQNVAVITHGFIYENRLPQLLTDAIRSTLKGITFIKENFKTKPTIKVINSQKFLLGSKKFVELIIYIEGAIFLPAVQLAGEYGCWTTSGTSDQWGVSKCDLLSTSMVKLTLDYKKLTTVGKVKVKCGYYGTSAQLSFNYEGPDAIEVLEVVKPDANDLKRQATKNGIIMSGGIKW